MGRVAHYEENHKIENDIEYKLCSICNEWFPMNNLYFYRNNKNKRDGYHPYCKECTKRKSIKWEKDNPEKHKRNYTRRNRHSEKHKERCRIKNKRNLENGYVRSWQMNNKDKLKEYGEKRQNKVHDIIPDEWEDCLNYFNNRCAYCGSITNEEHKLKYNQRLHMEHVIHEGRNDLKNCVPSCKNCNSEKHIFSLNNWYNENNVKYDYERYLRIYNWMRYDCLNYIQKKSKKQTN